jgi:hypothetical protein
MKGLRLISTPLHAANKAHMSQSTVQGANRQGRTDDFALKFVLPKMFGLAKGWTVRGSNPGEGEIFLTCPDWPWGPHSLLYNGYRVFPGGKGRPGRDADPSPPSSAVGHERVELYLCSPYGPHGLYRASVPVH